MRVIVMGVEEFLCTTNLLILANLILSEASPDFHVSAVQAF